jgi:hypothetical protein
MHLSLLPNTKITVIGDIGDKVIHKAVSECVGKQVVYDWFGNKKNITVQKSAQEEFKVMTTATSGEMCLFGDTHDVFVKDFNSIWTRRPLVSMQESAHVKLPQKKIKPNAGMLQYLDIDDKGLYLLVDKVSDFSLMLREMAYCGVKVNRHPSELRIELDRSKPPCFATKLLNGSFVYNLKNTLGTLAMGGVVSPSDLLTEAYLKLVENSGIIFEGANIFNEIPLLPAKVLATKTETYHVYLEDHSTPVELDWFCS